MNEARSSATLERSQKSRVGVVIAKEGGWGWMVVFAAFMVFMLSVGLTYSLGILLTELASYFNESKSATAWIASIAVGTSSCIGPIVCGLTNRYGCRVVVCAGALLTGFGLLISMPATNIFYLFLTIGAIVGSGIGMMYLPSVIIVNSYFEKKRALATGISMCGSSVGTFVMPPIAEFALVHYGSWRSALFILAGIMLNGAVFGSLYRPPDIRVLPVEASQEDENCQEILIFEPIPEVEEEYLPENTSGWKNVFTERNVYRTQSEPIEVKDFRKMPIRKAHSFSNLEVLEPQNRGSVSTIHPLSVFRYCGNRDDEISKATTQKNQSITRSSRAVSSHLSRGKSRYSGLLYRKDIFYTASLLTVPEYRYNPPEYYKALVTSVVDTGRERGRWREVWDALMQMMGFSLLKDKTYQMILLSRFIASLGVSAPYFFFLDRALDVGVSNGSYLVPVIGIGNMFGRLALGFISDYKSVNRTFLYAICMAICGIMIAASGFCYTFIAMSVVSVIYGFTIGAFACMLPIMLVEMLGITKLTNAYGLLLCFQGVATMVGLPAAGLLRDLTGSYTVGFVLSGVFVVLSCLIWCLIPLVDRFKPDVKAKRKRLQEKPDSTEHSRSQII